MSKSKGLVKEVGWEADAFEDLSGQLGRGDS